MNRKQLMESHGATCRNWQWSWSFINEKDRFIIFGAWDRDTQGTISRIFSESWKTNTQGRKNKAYDESRENIRLIEEEGYQLQTFPMIFSDANIDEKGIGPPKIDRIIPELTSKSLKKVGSDWYASDDAISNLLPEEVSNPEQYIEGTSKMVSVNTYERDVEARMKCLEHYGYECAVCRFNFEKFYGPIGEKYIHVHHLVPLADIKTEYQVDPIKDLLPVCPNCHGIIHRTRPALTVEQLKDYLAKTGKNL